MLCHAGRCKWADEFEVDKIVSMTGQLGSASELFRVRWKGYGAEEDTEEPRANLHPDLVREFTLANNIHGGQHNGPKCPRCDELFQDANDLQTHLQQCRITRCPYCEKKCKNYRGLTVHLRSCRVCPNSPQKFTGTRAETKVKEDKLIDMQSQRPVVMCENKTLKNVFRFKYLGAIFAADGSQHYDVRRRVGLAISRMGQLRQVYNASIKFTIKMKVYKAAICSLFTYGCEAWDLTRAAMAKLNGANACCLSRFTGKSAHQEASRLTRTYDLVASVRKRRMVWLGHILRMPGDRLLKLATKVQYEQQSKGSLFMDVPPHLSYDQIVSLAQDRKVWKQLQADTDFSRY